MHNANQLLLSLFRLKYYISQEIQGFKGHICLGCWRRHVSGWIYSQAISCWLYNWRWSLKGCSTIKISSPPAFNWEYTCLGRKWIFTRDCWSSIIWIHSTSITSLRGRPIARRGGRRGKRRRRGGWRRWRGWRIL